MINEQIQQALLEEAATHDERAEEFEENEEDVYTDEDIQGERERAEYLRQLAQHIS